MTDRRTDKPNDGHGGSRGRSFFKEVDRPTDRPTDSVAHREVILPINVIITNFIYNFNQRTYRVFQNY